MCFKGVGFIVSSLPIELKELNCELHSAARIGAAASNPLRSYGLVTPALKIL